MSYWENGLPHVRVPGAPGMPAITYAPDGEGRFGAAKASSGQNPANSVTYSLFGINNITYGSNDFDTFDYDPKTGRQIQYQYHVNGRTLVGNLTWNANGTLQQLAITDNFISSQSQTCSNTYDDLMRLTANNCGSNWSQSFGYDPFGNIDKTGSLSFQPTYTSGKTDNNRFVTLPSGTPAYDLNGNVTSDGYHPYTWDADGHMLSNDYLSAATYDALGRAVEITAGSFTQEVLYGADGAKLAYMNGGALLTAFEHLPKGALVSFDSTGTINAYGHPDWLGTQRVYSSPARGVNNDVNYAPYGESYPGNPTKFFTGVADNPLSSDIDTFPARELETREGRWLRPDPAGFAAVNFANPQTLNRYAYVMGNPLGFVDPSGLCTIDGDGRFRKDDEGPCLDENGNDLEGQSASGGGGSVTVTGTPDPVDPYEPVPLPPCLSLVCTGGGGQGGTGGGGSRGSAPVPPNKGKNPVRVCLDAACTMVTYLQPSDPPNWTKMGLYLACLANVDASYMTKHPEADIQDSSDTVPETQGMVKLQNKQSTNVIYGPGKGAKNGGQAPINPSGDSEVPGAVADRASYLLNVVQCVANVSNNF